MSTVDWNVLSDPTVVNLCKSAARAVHRQYPNAMEYDDFLQEAYIAAAQNAGVIRVHLREGNEGFAQRLLWQRVTDTARREHSAYGKHVVPLYDMAEPA
jgi:hypothetical protein